MVIIKKSSLQRMPNLITTALPETLKLIPIDTKSTIDESESEGLDTFVDEDVADEYEDVADEYEDYDDIAYVILYPRLTTVSVTINK